MVISIKMLAPGGDPAGYYLNRSAGCTADYYVGRTGPAGPAEHAGVWMGSGAQAAGLRGRLDPTGQKALRALLEGRDPGRQPLVREVLRCDPRGRLPATTLVEAIRSRAEQLEIVIEVLFTDPKDQAAFATLAAQVDKAVRPRRKPPTVRPAVAGRLATAAGLDPHRVFRVPGAKHPDGYAFAKRFAAKRVNIRRPGIDVTMSAPKPVSVLLALGSPEVAEQVRQAQDAAVGQALGYLESVAGHGLRGHQGGTERSEHVATEGWIVAGFEHHTSRTGDPQLHTHLVVPNLLHGVDGDWSAIDSKAIYRHQLTASYLYHAALRGELTQRLGVAWTAPVKGISSIVGIPDAVCDVFSTRRHQIEAAMAERGTSGPAAAQAAALATRPDKPAQEPEQTLRQRWTGQARAAGYDPAELVAGALGRVRPPAAPPIGQLAEHLLGPDGLTARATGFDRRDLLQALCQALPPGLRVGQASVQNAAERILRHRDAVRLATRSEDGPRWSTAELLRVEQAALGIAQHLRAAPDVGVAAECVDAATTGRTLSAEQLKMVRSLAAASGLAVVVGPAGAGKTAALAAATRTWTDQGRPVTGAAVAAVTARRLEHATGIRSSSLARLLRAAQRTDPTTGRAVGLPHGGVLVVDEASMADTRTLAKLLAHTASADATLVLVGDPAQLPEIGAGGLFIALTRHENTIRLTENRRQAELWERRALSDLRVGDPDAAVAAYAEHGRVHTAPPDELADRIVEDYLRLLEQKSGPMRAPAAGADESVVMLAVRRVDVTRLNDIARARLLENGRLGPDAVVAGHGNRAREYRAGDQIRVTRNDYRLGLLNGTRANVTAVDPGRDTMILATDEQQQVTVNVGWAGQHLDHGYAMTCHKAQGATVDTALLYGTGALTREAGYVALSRGRTENRIYVPDTTDELAVRREPDYLDELAARLAVRRTQTLATRQLPREQYEPRRRDPWQSHRLQHNTPDRAEGISR